MSSISFRGSPLLTDERFIESVAALVPREFIMLISNYVGQSQLSGRKMMRSRIMTYK